MENSRSLSLQKENLLPNTLARAKVTRMKVGLSTKMQCRKHVQIFNDLLLETVVKSS